MVACVKCNQKPKQTCDGVALHVVEQVDVAQHSHGHVGPPLRDDWFLLRPGRERRQAVHEGAVVQPRAGAHAPAGPRRLLGGGRRPLWLHRQADRSSPAMTARAARMSPAPGKHPSTCTVVGKQILLGNSIKRQIELFMIILHIFTLNSLQRSRTMSNCPIVRRPKHIAGTVRPVLHHFGRFCASHK